jgi:hypothetical protein
MVFERKPPSDEFHTSMKQVEDGLYRAQYSGEINPENPDAREIPDTHLGTSMAAGSSRWRWA